MLSDTVTENDPRIRKAAQAFYDDGWKVTTIGIRQDKPCAEDLPWVHLAIDIPEPYSLNPKPKTISKAGKVFSSVLLVGAKLLKPIHKALAGLMVKAANRAKRGQSVIDQLAHYFQLRFGLRFAPNSYKKVFWNISAHYPLLYQTVKKQVSDCDLWIANDWNMLPVAMKLQAEKGGKILYDSHEFAVDQFPGNKAFRKWQQPLVKAVERDCIGKVDAVTSVSQGICDALANRYQLDPPPVVVRNIPPFTRPKFRKTGDSINLLYQGVICPGRGLEALVASAQYWQDGRSLVLRGPESGAGYLQVLQGLIDELPDPDRVKLEPPIAFSELITKASEADVGVMLLGGSSVQEIYALPNKIFEYMMAGLAICVSNMPEMARIANEYKTGITVNDLDPQIIAKQINRLDQQLVDQYKLASIKAVQTLNWDNESKVLLGLSEKLCQRT